MVDCCVTSPDWYSDATLWYVLLGVSVTLSAAIITRAVAGVIVWAIRKGKRCTIKKKN